MYMYVLNSILSNNSCYLENKKKSNSIPFIHEWVHVINLYTLECTGKTQYRKFKTNIPRKRIARPQSQFPHSCVCERFIYFHYRSAYSATGKYVDRSWEYTIKRSQTHECGNWDWGRAFPFWEYTNGIFVAVCWTLTWRSAEDGRWLGGLRRGLGTAVSSPLGFKKYKN